MRAGTRWPALRSIPRPMPHGSASRRPPCLAHPRELARMPPTRYNRRMIETPLPLATNLWATGSSLDQAPLLEQLATLRLENATLRAENAALQARVRELEARLEQNSSNSSRAPSSDPRQAPARPKAPPSGRKRDSQRGVSCSFEVLLFPRWIFLVVFVNYRLLFRFAAVLGIAARLGEIAIVVL